MIGAFEEAFERHRLKPSADVVEDLEQTTLAIARITTAKMVEDYSLVEKLAYQRGLDIAIGLVYSGSTKIDILKTLVANVIAVKETIGQ
jgi:hypothetical protein